eukprot:SAG31_NODE_4684_length_3034_cov_1.497445_2_plen_114_part_00
MSPIERTWRNIVDKAYARCNVLPRRDHDNFANVIVPDGFTATLYAMPPMGDQNGHSHSDAELPNAIDPLGGWVNTGETYTEANGIPRDVWTKTVTGTYTLVHTTSHGWYVTSN